MTKHTFLYLAGILLFLSSLGAQAQTVTTFEGMDATTLAKPSIDPDPNGAVGTKQYMEWVNVYYQAYDKTTFLPVWSKPQAGTTPWVAAGNTDCSSISGDGVVNFDRLASRWVIAAHNSGSTNYFYCIAVSNTDDLSSPSLFWYTYSFSLNAVLGTNSKGTTYFPDWPKIGTWSDAYYVGMDLQDVNNGYQEVGVLACAFDRAHMLNGQNALNPQCFRYPSTVTGSLFLGHSLQPADVESTTPPPSGAPEYYASIQNPTADGVSTTSNSINLWQFHVDWTNPANSTFSLSTANVPTYTPGCYLPNAPPNTVCVPEPSTATTLQPIDSVGDRLMWRMAYRNFGSYESYLISHTVQTGTGTGSQTGIRWYELRGSGVPTVYQSGTISPDTSLYRFMPSIAQDQAGNAAVGYSTSSAAAHPGISASWWNLVSQTTPTELTLYNGIADEENSYRYGDYTSMTVDPVGECAFWYVNEYFNTNQIGTGKPVWQTRISTFSIPTCSPVTLAPSSLTFAAQAVGTTSAGQTVTLTNNQSATLNITKIFGSGADPGDFGVSSNCGSTVAAGGSCTITVTFKPTTTGTRTATLNVSDDASNSPQQVSLTGTGTSAPTLTISPSSISFGNYAVGFTTPVSPVTVTNTSTSTVTFTSIALTGTNTADFGQSNNCGTSLGAGLACTINVTFTPAATGAFSASVALTDNAANSPQSVALTGTGVAPVVLSATSEDLGTILIGGTKAGTAITFTNQEPVALAVSFALTGSTEFTQTNTCGTSVAAGASCTITPTFKPTAAGLVSGTITITDSASNSPQTITLSGTGELPVVLNPANLSFGTVKVGTTSAAKTIVMTNNLKNTLSITSITLTGVHPLDYAETNNCGTSLASKATCAISVTFTPKATGVRPASLSVADSANTSPQVAKLGGTGD
jgi:Abnormal spindle-like microcephaly-assoc'd, ASPM-SPD-2-Hydin/Cep192 domain 4